MEFLKSKKFIILIFAILGLLASAELFHIYLEVNYNPYALSSFCSLNDVIDCDGVEKSMLSQVFGIPFACWGLFLYSVIIFFVFVDKIKNIKFLRFLKVFRHPNMYIAAIGYIALTLSLILATTAYILIKKICLMCAVTYIIDLSIGLVATDFKNGGIYKVFKTSIDDFIAAVKVPKYGISFALCCLVAAGFLYYSNDTFIFVPHLKMKRDVAYFERLIKTNPYSTLGNTFGDVNGKSNVMLFTDYQCPICRINNVMLSKALTEVDGVKIIHKNFPLDKKCNRLIGQDFHENACMYAKYSIAAEKQGKWGEMNHILFSRQPQSEFNILEIAGKYGFDTTKLEEDANSEDVINQLKNEIEEGLNAQVQGTPALVINGKLTQGLRPYKELKKMLKDSKNEK